MGQSIQEWIPYPLKFHKSIPYPFKFFKGCLPEFLFGPFLNTLSHLTLSAPIPQNGQTLKQFVGNLTTNCLSEFDHFVILALKGLIFQSNSNFSRLNAFHVTGLFLYLLKLLQKQRFSFFRGYRKGPVEWNGLNELESNVQCEQKPSITKCELLFFFLISFHFIKAVKLLKKLPTTTRSEINNHYT